MSILSRPATLGDVIAWIFTISTIAATLFCLRIPFIIPKFVPMFKSLHATLPAVTAMVLGMPALVWVLVPIVICVAVIKVLLTSQNDQLKVGMAVGGQVIVWGLLGMVVLGIFLPILELQKQLS